MTSFSRFLRVLDRLARKCREHRSHQAVAHLDDHLLRDIGLRREQGMIVPFHPESGSLEETLASAQPETEKQGLSGEVQCCPHCGASLA
ncbi:hypothetical protein GCM10007160_25200 [Litchfieldella qijiaojingensis]|uniref:YjiS-like domain-containing protein n=1 Tax=Litchfieldella qijiaojingensis TaxID=980347 RepID=A0ABQ2YVB0_9GAMM|nr:DUF1127 domain-containing protein [Halomonas qijiaojingensis]GGX96545.1 hypothetical protein GCM10007160_25200 [Halomonas qijiaojingensis]